MPRRKTPDPFADLAKKVEVLEREMSAQREALDKLKAMSAGARVVRTERPAPVRSAI